jgi:TDG/mug DNA glycosylase family protein
MIRDWPVTIGYVPVLADLLYPDVKLVVCGTAAGHRSAQLGAYYAGRGNQFWEMLYRVGVTPRVLKPTEFMRLQEYGIGLTDLAKETSGADSSLVAADFGPADLRTRIEQAQPLILAFNGKRAAEVFLARSVAFGYQPGRNIGRTRIFVAPSTSGAARGSWNERFWHDIMVAADLQAFPLPQALASSRRSRSPPRSGPPS